MGNKNILMPGDVAGHYNEKWTKTFDLQFLILWIVLFTALLVYTIFFDASLFHEKDFFIRLSSNKSFNFSFGWRAHLQTLLQH